MAGECNNPIHLVADGRLKNFFFPLSKMRVGARLDLDMLERNRLGFFSNARPHFVPEGCGALQCVDQNPQSFFGR